MIYVKLVSENCATLDDNKTTINEHPEQTNRYPETQKKEYGKPLFLKTHTQRCGQKYIYIERWDLLKVHLF